MNKNPQGRWLYKIVYEEPRRPAKEMYFRIVTGSPDYHGKTQRMVEISEWSSGSCESKKVYQLDMGRKIWNDFVRRGYIPSEPEEYLAGAKSPLHTSHEKAEYLRNGNREVKKSFEKRMMNE